MSDAVVAVVQVSIDLTVSFIRSAYAWVNVISSAIDVDLSQSV